MSKMMSKKGRHTFFQFKKACLDYDICLLTKMTRQNFLPLLPFSLLRIFLPMLPLFIGGALREKKVDMSEETQVFCLLYPYSSSMCNIFSL